MEAFLLMCAARAVDKNSYSGFDTVPRVYFEYNTLENFSLMTYN